MTEHLTPEALESGELRAISPLGGLDAVGEDVARDHEPTFVGECVICCSPFVLDPYGSAVFCDDCANRSVTAGGQT